MANYVTISAIGPHIHGAGSPPLGQEAVDRMIESWKARIAQVLPDEPDLIALPEACDRYPGHALEQRYDYYRTRGDQVREFLAGIAKERSCNIAYSAARELPGDRWVNSTQIIGRDGCVVGAYNKNHTTIGETEKYGILMGRDAKVIECDFGRVACAICFDLNFNDLRLDYAAQRPDLIVFSSMYHGGLMQHYWAYSCRAHFVGAVPGRNCSVISPVGDLVAAGTNYFDYATATVNLDCRVVHLDFNWGRLTAMREKYGPRVSVYDPGFLGAVLISSETDEFTIDDMIAEFEIEQLDDYFERSQAMRERTDLMAP